jgi:hypothetical protein
MNYATTEANALTEITKNMSHMQIAIPCKPIHTLHQHKMYEPMQQNLLTNGTKISATKILEGRSTHVHRSSSCEYPRTTVTGGATSLSTTPAKTRQQLS